MHPVSRPLRRPAVPIARPQSVGEELANSLSHGIGFLGAVVSLPVLVSMALRRGDATLDVVACCVFSLTMMLLYLTSTVYHALPDGRAKQVCNRLDHAAIYLFIAGSYTPFALGALRGGLGWTLFGVIWTLATLGMLAKLFNRLSHPLASTLLYVGMGWIAVFAAGPLMKQVSATGVQLLIAGGVAYTLGALVFLLDSRLRYAHFVWHLFVLGGSTCHFLAALWRRG